MPVNNRILLILCGLAAMATARVAVAADDDNDARPTKPAPARVPGEKVGGGGGAIGGAGTFTLSGVNGTAVADTVVVEGDSGLAITGNRVVNFIATQPGGLARAAYLGITTSSPDAALQKQLQLKPGVGLVVDSVEADSPAEKAGVRQYDVLHKIDEQLMINTDQMAVLIRSYDPGKEVKLTVIREGKPETLTAKLGERAVPPITLRLVAPALSNATFRPAGSFESNGTLMLQPLDDKRQPGAAQIVIDDGTRKLTISTAGGHKRMKGQDKSGKVLFDTAIETKEDLEKVAPEFRKLYQELPQSQPATPPTTPPTTTTPQPTPAPQR